MIFGWDLGGAHVKAAVLDGNGGLARVAQRAVRSGSDGSISSARWREFAGGESPRARTR